MYNAMYDNDLAVMWTAATLYGTGLRHIGQRALSCSDLLILNVYILDMIFN